MLNLFMVGALLAAPNPPTLPETFSVVSPHHLVVTVPADAELVEDPTDWAFVSADDPNYARVTTAEDITFTVRPGAVTRTDDGLSFQREARILLRLSAPLQAGATYEIGWTSGEQSWTWTFDPTTVWTPSLKVNQAGYLPDSPLRYAYASYWLGYMEPMTPQGDFARVLVMNAETDEVAEETRLALRLSHDAQTEDAYSANFTRANVYQIDLFRLNPGWYYLVWEGVGRSWTFQVGHEAFDETFNTALRGLSSLRCGPPAADGEPARFVPASCQAGDVVLTNFDRYTSNEPQLLLGGATEETRAITGGYHDGTGHIRDVRQLAVVDALVDLYEVSPERFAHDDLGLPESGNGIPDVLDEAIWALDFFAQLQEMPGGVRTGIARIQAAPFSPYPPAADADATWHAYAPSPFTSYRFAGAAAKLARAVQRWNGAVAQRWTDRARRAWSWAESQRPAEEDPLWLTYAPMIGIASVDAYAAAELLNTTGDGTFDEAFKRYMPFDEDLELTIERFRRADEVIWPLMSYARSRRTTAPVVEAALATLTARIDQVVSGAEGTGYRFAKHTYDTVDSGALAIPEYAAFLFRMAELTDVEDYRTWGAFTCDVTLGSNPMGLAWLTGVGSRAVEAASLPGVVRPEAPDAPAGLPIMGPCARAEACLAEGQALAESIGTWEPALEEWPPAETFIDSALIPENTRVSVAETIAPTLYALGYMSRQGAFPEGQEMMGGMGGMMGGGGTPTQGGEMGAGGAGPEGGMTGGMMMPADGGQSAAGGDAGGSMGAGGAETPDAPAPSDGDEGCRAASGADTLIWLWLLLGLGGLGRRRERR